MVIEQNIVPQIVFDNLSVTLRTDGIFCVELSTNNDIEVEDVKKVVEAIERIGQGKKYPVLIILQKYTVPTPEAREYVATADSDPYASAEAYVINSLSQKLVANVYLNFNKPARPTKFFNSEEKAIEWLRKYL